MLSQQSSYDNAQQNKINETWGSINSQDQSRLTRSVNVSIPEVLPENMSQNHYFYEGSKVDNPDNMKKKLKIEKAKTKKLNEIVDELKAQLKIANKEIRWLKDELVHKKTKSKPRDLK